MTIYIEGPGFKTALARSSDTWSLNGNVVDAAPVWGLLGQLAHLRAEAFADSTQPPEKLTHASCIVQLRNGTTRQLRLGRPDPATKRYPAAVDKDPGIAWISEAAAKSILQKPSDFKSK